MTGPFHPTGITAFREQTARFAMTLTETKTVPPKTRPLLLATLCLLPFGAQAQEDETNVETLPEMTVTATRIEQPVERVPASVTVIDREEIERNNYQTLADALMTVPGISLTPTGGIGGLNNLQIRGAPSNNTRVLIDGIPVNDSSAGDKFDFGVDLLGDVERIEVVRGPGAALYGNNSAGGVINIITRDGLGEDPAVYGSIAAGTQNTLRGIAGSEGQVGAFNYNLSLQGFRTDGFNITPDRREPNFGEEDGFDNYTFTGAAGYDVSDRVRVDGLLRVRRAESDIDNGGSDDPDQVNKADQIVWRAGGELLSFDGRLTSRLDVGQSRHDRQDIDHPDAGDPFDTNDTFNSRRTYASFQNTLEAGDFGAAEDVRFVAGVDLARESIDVSNFGDVEEEEDEVGYFVQGQATFLDSLDLTLSGRLSDRENFSAQATWRAAAVWTVGPWDTRLKGAIGTAYLAPSLIDRFGPFGNPDLQEETSRSWEIGFEQDVALAGRPEGLSFGVTYFQTRIDDLISFNPETFVSENINEAEIEGIESFVGVQPADWIAARLSWTWTNSRDVMNDRPLGRSPKHKIAASATVTPLEDWTISPEIVYASEAIEYLYPDGSGFGDLGYGEGYTLVNLATTYDIDETYTLFGRIENLLDRDYETPNGYAAPGFTALVGIRARY
ncbi:TonB-dependent receptor [Inquilinus sp. CAU 1745]|uniref:TonB-dependent receptor plug domain-containing protein n=1 Tax=Inquilinus sp. CAU 1745 TaxID=3140369 RepID=UPI00325AC681